MIFPISEQVAVAEQQPEEGAVAGAEHPAPGPAYAARPTR